MTMKNDKGFWRNCWTGWVFGCVLNLLTVVVLTTWFEGKSFVWQTCPRCEKVEFESVYCDAENEPSVTKECPPGMNCRGDRPAPGSVQAVCDAVIKNNWASAFYQCESRCDSFVKRQKQFFEEWRKDWEARNAERLKRIEKMKGSNGNEI